MDVIFEEETTIARSRVPVSKTGPIVKFIMKVSGGRIQHESTASVLLIVIAITALVLSIIVMRTLVIAPPAEPILSPYDG